MLTALAYYEPLANYLQPAPPVPHTRLPGPLPLGFPEAFRARLISLASDPSVGNDTMQRLYFDLVVCPQIEASMRRMHPASQAGLDQPRSEAIFLDPAFSWTIHLDDRLHRRWQDCLLRHGERAGLEDVVGLLAGFRILAEHLGDRAAWANTPWRPPVDL
ncbi:hypothetical protein FNU76_02155 [Chitinimonas arctica]|uniref:Uncharacterized protein n=1 Tax=Chitinimonas arctica TaxID=2594795 RepID=A0A516SAS9_9NEIS|nr:hypothetical protein [Chitinimonas arctica]QDQ25249.1 hypothetical protein FNU76_02155 [Chitinimonas arctica]